MPDSTPAPTTTPTPTTFAATLPEALRGHEAFKDVKDVGDLATRYVAASTSKPFAEQLPKEIAGEAYFKDIKDLPALATRAWNQAKMIGRDPNTMAIIPAKEDAAGWEALYGRLGRPAKPEEYTLTPRQGTEFTDQDRAFHAAILPAAHKAGLNQSQLAILAEAFNGFGATATNQRSQADAAAIEETARALRNQWGNAFEARVDRANLGLTYYAKQAGVDIKELNDELDRGKLGNRPALARILDHIGAQLEEDGLIGRATGGGADVSTPNEAKQQLDALMQDKQFLAAWTDKMHPQHKEAMDRRARLFDQAYPAPAA